MKENIAQEFRERTVRSFLDLLIITMLTKNPTPSVDDLMNLVHQKFKVSLSPGILYSHLFHLKQDGLINNESTKKKRTYRITQKGKELLNTAKKHRSAAKWVIDQILEENPSLRSQ